MGADRKPGGGEGAGRTFVDVLEQGCSGGGAVAVAAKKGFFGVILGFLAAAWKFIVVGVIALGAWFKSVFSGKDKPRK